MAWKSTDTFPRQHGYGLVERSTERYFRPIWDWQQQRVIDFVVDGIMDMIHAYENKSLGFIYAGYMLDVAQLTGDFCYWNGSGNVLSPVDLLDRF